ncbi:MAG TPA: nicotinamide-nucleotide amidohydrolase family protein [Tepidisphaeraceae bacterium]|jgi:nicotinamide-nucleotide amidase
MNAIILSIGDELILGQTVDTNSAWLSRQLAAIGCEILAHITVSDAQPAIEAAIGDVAGRCEFLIISGGIGPTPDDLTRQALAAVLGQPLELNEVWLAQLESFFHARGREMPPINRIQAMIPRGAQMIFNHNGTAAGIAATISEPAPTSASDPRASARDRTHACRCFVMPGVPREMFAMFARDVLPEIVKDRSAGGGAGGASGIILSRTLHTFGLGESAIAEKLGQLMNRERNPSVGTTVANGLVSLRLNARFPDPPYPAQAREALDQTAAACRAALGDLIFGQDEETLPDAVAKLLLADETAQKFAPAVATAESCTGGLLAKLLTDVPGSSAYFRQGYITYHDEAKTDLLNVPPDLIAQHGAVSEQVVLAMAQGAQQQSGAAYTLAISGIAGPSGGTPEKAVGTVWIALAHPPGPASSAAGAFARKFLFPGDRSSIRDRAALMTLTMLRYHLLGKELPF